MKHLAKEIKFTIFTLGVLFLAMIVLAFTSKPFYWYFNLGQNPNEEMSITRPESIVMFGGAGMPSEDNLMRLYHTAVLARHFGIPVILVHPEDSLCQTEMTRLLRQGGLPCHCRFRFVAEKTETRWK